MACTAARLSIRRKKRCIIARSCRSSSHEPQARASPARTMRTPNLRRRRASPLASRHRSSAPTRVRLSARRRQLSMREIESRDPSAKPHHALNARETAAFMATETTRRMRSSSSISSHHEPHARSNRRLSIRRPTEQTEAWHTPAAQEGQRRASRS